MRPCSPAIRFPRFGRVSAQWGTGFDRQRAGRQDAQESRRQWRKPERSGCQDGSDAGEPRRRGCSLELARHREPDAAVARRVRSKSVRPPIVYFNIGWMQNYAGTSPDDQTRGAHGYLKARIDHGAAVRPTFCPLPMVQFGATALRVKRRKPTSHGWAPVLRQTSIDGALVIWLAKEPASGRTLVVGWYWNATVYREARDSGIDLNGERIHYSVEARARDATRLAPVERTFEVRSSRRNPGGGCERSRPGTEPTRLIAKVWAYVQSRLSMRPCCGASALPTSRQRSARPGVAAEGRASGRRARRRLLQIKIWRRLHSPKRGEVSRGGAGSWKSSAKTSPC